MEELNAKSFMFLFLLSKYCNSVFYEKCIERNTIAHERESRWVRVVSYKFPDIMAPQFDFRLKFGVEGSGHCRQERSRHRSRTSIWNKPPRIIILSKIHINVGFDNASCSQECDFVDGSRRRDVAVLSIADVKHE
jgi:hypothetical protein